MNSTLWVLQNSFDNTVSILISVGLTNCLLFESELDIDNTYFVTYQYHIYGLSEALDFLLAHLQIQTIPIKNKLKSDVLYQFVLCNNFEKVTF